ncbi:MAG: hypothetical protein CEE43_01395 [Promethearchaeota archaeon Loki_b32]|nr:MAG: hypothetical protein CEE43_01395 [Candidatus Lokiarchaeota archaeon Loki_b32]
MPRVEIEDDMNASAKTIYDILINGDEYEVKWNLTANELKSIGPKKWEVKSTIGDLISTRVEEVENERVSLDIEGSIFTKMGYILKQKGDICHVVGWGEFEHEKNRKILISAGGMLLDSLKRFAEFMEEGGDPENFDKKALTVTP